MAVNNLVVTWTAHTRLHQLQVCVRGSFFLHPSTCPLSRLLLASKKIQPGSMSPNAVFLSLEFHSNCFHLTNFITSFIRITNALIWLILLQWPHKRQLVTLEARAKPHYRLNNAFWGLWFLTHKKNKYIIRCNNFALWGQAKMYSPIYL